jgi:hypothetical protein
MWSVAEKRMTNAEAARNPLMFSPWRSLAMDGNCQGSTASLKYSVRLATIHGRQSDDAHLVSAA